MLGSRQTWEVIVRAADYYSGKLPMSYYYCVKSRSMLDSPQREHEIAIKVSRVLVK